MQSTSSRAVAALLLTMLFWGSSAVFMRSLALSLTPQDSLAMRYTLLTAINIGGLVWFGTWRIPMADWGRFLFTGVFGMAGYNWFVNAGYELVPAGVGTLITTIEPLMIAVLAAVVLGEKLNRYIFLGVALAIIGAVVLFWQDLTATAPSTVPPRGVIYLVLCCVGWAVYTVAAKPLLERHDSFTVTAVTMLVAAPILIGAASEPVPVLAAKLDLGQWAEVVYLVLAAGIGGTMMWNYGTRHLSSAAAATFLYLIPVVAVVSGATILGEQVTAFIMAGGLLMLAGVAAAQFGPKLFRHR